MREIRIAAVVEDKLETAKKNLAKNLHTWRERKGMKIEVAARQLGVSTATWGHWETGRRFPALHHLSCLSLYMKIPICRLICHYDDDCIKCTDKRGPEG